MKILLDRMTKPILNIVDYIESSLKYMYLFIDSYFSIFKAVSGHIVKIISITMYFNDVITMLRYMY